MKKLVLLLLAGFVMTAPTAFAQGDDYDAYRGGSGGALSYGVKAGLVHSSFGNLEYMQPYTLLDNRISGSERRAGFSAGIFADYQIMDNLGVTLEVLYAQEGAMKVNSSNIYRYTTINTSRVPIAYNGNLMAYSSIDKMNSNVILHNIELPVLVNYTVDINKMKLKLFTGASFDFILQATSYDLLRVRSYDGLPNLPGTNYTAYTLPQRAKKNVTSSFEYYNIGVVVGAGMDFGKFTADVRFKRGVKAINNLATLEYQNTNRTDFSSNAVMLSLGVKINEFL